MKAANHKYYYFLLFIGVGLLAFTFYFTYERYSLFQTADDTARKINGAVYAYEELSDDYKSAIVICASSEQMQPKYTDIFEDDAKDIQADVEQIKAAAEDNESSKRADTLQQLLNAQSVWILKPHGINPLLSDKTDDKLNGIISTKAIIERGEIHVRELLKGHTQQLNKSFSSIYQWMLILISTSAVLIVTIVTLILLQIKKEQKHLQKIDLQKNRLEEIAWIQSHKVRSPVATILGLAQLFNYKDLSDPFNAEIILGFTESAEKLDKIIMEIDVKTRVPDEKITKIKTQFDSINIPLPHHYANVDGTKAKWVI